MPNNLPIPDDLQHLIEKRDGVERRSTAGANEAAPSQQADAPTSDEATERRQAIRRTEDRDA